MEDLCSPQGQERPGSEGQLCPQDTAPCQALCSSPGLPTWFHVLRLLQGALLHPLPSCPSSVCPSAHPPAVHPHLAPAEV